MMKKNKEEIIKKNKALVKKNKALIFLLSIVFLLSGCTQKVPKDDLTKGLLSSGGKTLEMLVVVPKDVLTGALRDTIGEYFEKACPNLPQKEPLFDVVQVDPEGYYSSTILQQHRNILILDYKKTNPNNILGQVDKRYYPQALFKISANNKDSLISILSQYANTIRHQFYENEHKRIYVAMKKQENVKLNPQIQKFFGFKLMFSDEYYLATKDTNFFWIRKETTNESFNVMIYKEKYTGEGLFDQKKIIELRDKISKQYIPGPTHGSYMGTETRVNLVGDFTRRNVKIGKYTAVETRGMWRLFGNFMGGGFVNYCFLNPKTNEFIMIDCFLYSPKKSKRDNLMQLESIIYNIQ
jgi:hypothetical protein